MIGSGSADVYRCLLPVYCQMLCKDSRVDVDRSPLVLRVVILCKLNIAAALSDAASSFSPTSFYTNAGYSIVISRHFMMKTTVILLDYSDAVLDANSKDGRSSVVLDCHPSPSLSPSPSHLFTKINYIPP